MQRFKWFIRYVVGCNCVNGVARNVALSFPSVAYHMLMASLQHCYSIGRQKQCMVTIENESEIGKSL